MRRPVSVVPFCFAAILSACAGEKDESTDTTDMSDAMTDDAMTDDDDAATDEAPASCTTQMFDKYGLDAFVIVNDAIIAKAVAAPTSEVGPTFQALAAQPAERVEAFRTNLANFLVMVYGGPNNYTGPDMVTAHAGLGITSAQYDYFIANVVVPALAESGVAESDIADCFAPPVVDPAFKATIVEE